MGHAQYCGKTKNPHYLVTSQNKDLIINEDGSVDDYFFSTAPARKENNWIQNVPGKGRNTLFRLYGPLESWFDKTCKLSEIEEIN